MALFDDLSKKLKEAGQTAAKKTRDLTDITRYNASIGDEERVIRELHGKIGQLYCELHKKDHEEAFSDLIVQVKVAEERIAGYREKIEQLKGMGRCPACGASVPANAAFCPACGTAVPKQEQVETSEPAEEIEQPAAEDQKEDEMPAVKVCVSCGAVMDNELRFCTECGMKLD